MDGVTWNNEVWSIPFQFNGVTFGGGKFVAVGFGGAILTDDGSGWASHSVGASEILQGVAYGNGTYVAVGANGMIVTSGDGLTWASRTSGTVNDLYRVAYRG